MDTHFELILNQEYVVRKQMHKTSTFRMCSHFIILKKKIASIGKESPHVQYDSFVKLHLQITLSIKCWISISYIMYKYMMKQPRQFEIHADKTYRLHLEVNFHPQIN